jgi:hypothetical protein
MGAGNPIDDWKRRLIRGASFISGFGEHWIQAPNMVSQYCSCFFGGIRPE